MDRKKEIEFLIKNARVPQSILIPLVNYLEGDDLPPLPNHVQVVMVGEWKTHPTGAFKVTEKEVTEIVRNFDRVVADVVIDIEHQSLIHGHDAPAAGWIKKLYDKGSAGVWADVEWTDLGERMLYSKEKRYFSPVIIFNYEEPETGKKIGAKLDSEALTNRPYLENLQAIVNSKAFQNNKNGVNNMDFLKQLAEKLGLKADENVTEDAVLAAMSKSLETAKSNQTKLDAFFKALELGDDATVEQIQEKVTAMSKANPDDKNTGKENESEEYKAALSRIESIEKMVLDKNKSDFISEGIRQGKIIAANKAYFEKLYEGDPKAAADVLKEAIVLVPMSKVGDNLPDDTGGVPDETQQEVNNQMGISPEDYKKYNTKK